jgi:hypothetical protein
MRSALTAVVAGLASTAAVAAALTYTTPQGWIARPPSSSMRVAEFVLPHVPGDTADAELVVYYFGGEGGSVEANMQRWIGQMRQPGGGSSQAAAKRAVRTVNGLKVTLLDVSGTYTAEMRPGSAEHHDNPDYRMRAGVVETPKGPYFIKLVGPAKTVGRWERAFDRFVDSLNFA